MSTTDAGASSNAVPGSDLRPQHRARGDVSRERILDAVAEITAERGYDGTSISLVSERSGLPASSIYWHFENKDQLITAVIDRSFKRFLEKLTPTIERAAGNSPDLATILVSAAAKLLEESHHVRFGLMLLLDRRPQELSGRRLFLEQRCAIREIGVKVWQLVMPQLSPRSHQRLMVLTLAGIDGLYLAHESENVEFLAQIELFATGLMAVGRRLEEEEQEQASRVEAETRSAGPAQRETTSDP
jgi:AcrR family transcriptional regulator